MQEDEWAAVLARHDQADLAAALHRLRQDVDDMRGLAVPPPDIAVVAMLGDDASEATMLDLTEILTRRGAFDPPFAGRDHIPALIALALRCATSYVAFEIALSFRIADDPERTLAAAIDEIARQGIHGPGQLQRAQALLTRLFDTEHEYRVTMIDRLRAWPREHPFDELIGYIVPQLTLEEHGLLTRP